jgi:endoglucanase
MHRRGLFLLLIISSLMVMAKGKHEKKNDELAWIRINQLGYTPGGVKVAVWCGKEGAVMNDWLLVDEATGENVASGKPGKDFGAYGPFTHTGRIDFSSFRKPGRYYLRAGDTRSPTFTIGSDVYKGAADFCLRYMRQQRSGFNPFLKDSCHTTDGYAMYGEAAGLKDSTHIDVSGGWHDATDYLQYATTSANAAYHLLMAYRDFPAVFGDTKQANGLEGSNNVPDVLDEARWGIDWLLKMHPKDDWMFNQLADDRDHTGMRLPGLDSQYGKGSERPVYFITGEPQGLGKYKNRTKGTSSTAAKLSSVFCLGSQLFAKTDPRYSRILVPKARSAMKYSEKKKGVTQTAPMKAPYFYEEDNWTDDMELEFAAAAAQAQTFSGNNIDTAYYYAGQETVTPWLGKDTAHHYQWYPFINLGHRELARQLAGKKDPSYARMRSQLIAWYREGIESVWQKAENNAFYRGIPFIWCSNNLTVSFAIQCRWYKELSGNTDFDALEQANIDWLFGCNPWGTGMVYGLPAWGDTPADPHSSLSHLKKYPIDGGLVDGPVYTSIYSHLLGIALNEPDEYAAFQSGLAVYHDDVGDYSTNEPTMDGTASLIYLLAAKENESKTSPQPNAHAGFLYDHGAIVRGDTTKKELALVFTGDGFADGANSITATLDRQKVKASFFLTGNFYRNTNFRKLILALKARGHYLGPHSNTHLLYCDWTERDSLLVSQSVFRNDLLANYKAMAAFGIDRNQASWFLPPYEWHNDSVASWTSQLGIQLINYSPGTRSNADYTWPELKGYRSSEEIFRSILDFERKDPAGLNGFVLLLHIGTDPRRTDKFYSRLNELIRYIKGKGYHFRTVDQLLRIN